MRLFDEGDDLLEDGRVVNSEIRESLAVNLDTLEVESANEGGILHSMHADSVIDTHVPDGAERSLLLLASDVGIGSCLHESILRATEHVLVHHAEALYLGKEILVALLGLKTALDSGHGSLV